MNKVYRHNLAGWVLLLLFLFSLFLQENPDVSVTGESGEHTMTCMFKAIPFSFSTENTTNNQDSENHRLNSCLSLPFHTSIKEFHLQNTSFAYLPHQLTPVFLAATPPAALRAPPTVNVNI